MEHAKDKKCFDCGKQAVAFFPVCDVDIPAYPRCRKCIDKIKMSIMNNLLGK